MEIRWLGRASFLISSAVGTVITDPFPEAIADQPDQDQLIAVYSRQTGIVSSFQNKITTIAGPGEYEVSGISILGIPTPAGNGDADRRISTHYVINADGISVCALGLIAAIPDARTLRATGNVDVVLAHAHPDSPLPAEQLAAAVRLMEPKIAAPTGFDPAAGQPGPELRRFIEELGAKPGDSVPRLTITAANLPEETRVAILQPRPPA